MRAADSTTAAAATTTAVEHATEAIAEPSRMQAKTTPTSVPLRSERARLTPIRTLPTP